MTQAEYFDGQSALSQNVRVHIEGTSLVIESSKAGPALARWLLHDVRWISGTDKPILSSASAPDARLILMDISLADELAERYPELKGNVPTAKSQKTHKKAWTYGLAAAALTIAIFVAVPWLSGPLAQIVSEDWRKNLGRQSVEQIETLLGKRCENEPGQTILTNMANQLVGHLPDPETLHVGVIDNRMVNAFALPGGYIRFMRGLIKEANSPDEVAGVLAHEIGHVALRHAEEQTFRQLGYEIVLSTIADSGALTEIAASAGVQLISAAHSREAETAADLLAIDLLKKSDISRKGMVTFFDRIEKMEGKSPKILKYLSSHPATGERKKTAEANIDSGKAALSDADWQALKKICD